MTEPYNFWHKAFLFSLGKENALHLTVFSIFFFSTNFPEYRVIQSKKNIVQISEQLYNLTICC